MCRAGITLGVSAIAAITSSVKSFGCGEVNRTRSSPSICRTARSSAAKACRSPNSTPYALTFWPSSVTSWTPSATSAEISARMSPGRRSVSRPRSAGTMQKVQVLLQPTLIETHAAYAESRRVGRLEGKVCSASLISTCASCSTRARSSSTGSEPMLCVPNTTSTQGARSQDRVLVLLGQAAAYGDLHARVRLLRRQQIDRGCRTAGCRRSPAPRRC